MLTVKQLIEMLKAVDPETPVMLHVADGGYNPPRQLKTLDVVNRGYSIPDMGDWVEEYWAEDCEDDDEDCEDVDIINVVVIR